MSQRADRGLRSLPPAPIARQQAITQIKQRRNLLEKGAKMMPDTRPVSAPSNLTHRVASSLITASLRRLPRRRGLLFMGAILIGSAAVSTMGALPAAATDPGSVELIPR